MGHPLIKAKDGPPPIRTTGAHELGMVAGVLTCGVSVLIIGIDIVSSWLWDPASPAWILSVGLFFLGIGATTLSLLPPLFESPDHSPVTRRRRRWASYAVTRAALATVAVNLPLAAYMGGLAYVARLPNWLLLGVCVAANLAALGLAVATTPEARRRQLSALGEGTLLRWHGAALEVHVSCPFCSTVVSPEDAACCRSCETLHHRECWSEFDGCSVFGCGDHAAQALDGRPV
jgi:hypothetical protein